MGKQIFSVFIIISILFSAHILHGQIGPVKQWDKTFGGNLDDAPHKLRVTVNGGYLIGGYSWSGLSGDKSQISKGSSDFWILMTDNNGVKVWDKSFGGSGFDNLIDLQQTTDGGYILAGHSNSGIGSDKSQASKGSLDYWVVKIDANGNKLWDKTYGSSNTDYLNTIRQTSDGGYILGGLSDGSNDGDKSQPSRGVQDYWVIKLDSLGNKQWDQTLGGSSLDFITSIIQTADGGYLVGGYSNSGVSGDKSQPSRGDSDFWIIKLNASGAKLWDKTIGGNNAETWMDLLQTSNGNYIIGG